MTVGRTRGSGSCRVIEAARLNTTILRPRLRFVNRKRARCCALMLVFLLVQHSSAIEGGSASTRPPNVVAGLGRRRRDADDQESFGRGEGSSSRRGGFVIRGASVFGAGSTRETCTKDSGDDRLAREKISGWATTANVNHGGANGPSPGSPAGARAMRPDVAARRAGRGEESAAGNEGPGYFPRGSREVGDEISGGATPPDLFETAGERIAAGLIAGFSAFAFPGLTELEQRNDRSGVMMSQSQDAGSSAYPEPLITPSTQRSGEVGSGPRTRQEAPSLYQEAGRETLFVMFLILAWRSMSNLETVTLLSGALKASMVLPATGLFVGNLVCMCLSLVRSATVRQKARMKIMLNIDAAAEAILLAFNLVRYFYSEPLGREELLVGLFANLWFVSLCYTFRKARWTVDDGW